IGYVKRELPVSLKVDTFDFQKYGVLRGVITHIPKDSTDNETLGPIYLVDITPIDHELLVEGRKEPLSNGLSVTAEIKVGKRRIIEFFIYPLIKHWHEGLSVR